MLNNPNRGSVPQSPRGMVLANGQRLSGLFSFSVDNNDFFHADTFTFTLTMSAQPPATNFDWWSRQEKLEVELLVGFPTDPNNYDKSDLTSYLVGYVDDLQFDPIADQMVFSGRDLTSKLIDTKNTLFQKAMHPMTSSNIVTQIAAQVGLTPVVTKTTGSSPGSTYYQIIDSLLKAHCSYWDIVTKLAQIEGFRAYVQGHELHFEPRAAADADPFMIQWVPPSTGGYPSSNAVDLTFSRNLSVAKDLKVIVLSYNPKANKTFTATATRPRAGSGKAVPFQEQQVYTFNAANKTQAQAQEIANNKLKELSLHEMNLHARLPGETALTPRNLIQVTGTGTAFDQTYFASSITRNYSLTDGFTMSLLGKNQTPNNPT
jgi:phage protein D